MRPPPSRVHVTYPITIEHTDDDLDIGQMIEFASSTWVGPNTRVSQARWGAADAHAGQHGGEVNLSDVAEALTTIIFFTVGCGRWLGGVVKRSGAADMLAAVVSLGVEHRRLMTRLVKLSAPAVAFTGVIFVSVFLAAAAVTPVGTAASGTNGVWRLFAGRAAATPNRAPTITTSSQSPGRVAPTHVATPQSRPSARPTPGPTDE